MGAKLLPLSVTELCAHALELERDAGLRYREYAKRMFELGAVKVGSAFIEMSREQEDEARELESASGEQQPSELSPWEYTWRLTYLPEAMERQPRVVPMSAREALQLAMFAKHRAEMFYNDVAENAKDSMVRGCAAEMASASLRQIQSLERLLAGEVSSQVPRPLHHAGTRHP